MSKPLDSATPDPGKKREKPPTLEELAEELRQHLGPDCPVTINYPEPPTDGTIKTKFFFVNPRQNTEANPEQMHRLPPDPKLIPPRHH